MTDLQSQILAAINFVSLNSIVIAAGLALIGLSFVVFLLNTGRAAASGNIGDSSSDDDEDD